ncbi:MAG: HpcH/HpaI aldolase family protein [Magnetovibrionaceae bacterium]
MNRNVSLKKQLKAREVTIGSWVTLGSSAVAELMARAGFDWLVIDAEHSVIETSHVQEMIQAIEGAEVPVIVRLTSNNADQIKQVMDAGATGIMVPNIRSAADAAAAVSATYYPPRGTRGVGLARAQGYGAAFEEYKAWLEQGGIVIAMIEHIEAVEAADEILSLDGIDGYIIGPFDLSASMGKPGKFDDADVMEAIQCVREAGDRAGKPGGIHVVDPDLERLKARLDEGFQFVGYGMDIRIIDCLARDHLAKIRKDFLK